MKNSRGALRAEETKFVQGWMKGRRLTKLAEAYKKRYNDSLSMSYMGEKLILDTPMHVFQVDIEVLGVDFHRTFSLTTPSEPIIAHMLKKSIEELSRDIMRFKEAPKPSERAETPKDMISGECLLEEDIHCKSQRCGCECHKPTNKQIVGE